MLETSNDEIYEQNKQKLEKKYDIIETLAKGAFGVVYKAKDRSTQQTVAIKIITKNKAKKSSMQQIQRELTILQTVNHPNVLKLIEFFETKSKVYIVTEYIKYGNLKDFVTKNKGKITEQQSKQIALTLLQTVEYLHKYDICHRDLKLANIMLSDEKDFSKIKVIDFGLSIKFENQYETGFCGTLKYMAPEMALGMKYTKKVDIWSVGIIFFILLNQGKHPFYEPNDNKKTYMKKLKNVNIKYPPTMTEECVDICAKMLEPEPTLRYSASGCLKMYYFKEGSSKHTKNEISLINKKKAFKNMLLTMVLLNQYKKKSLILSSSKKHADSNNSHTHSNYGIFNIKVEKNPNYRPPTTYNTIKEKNPLKKSQHIKSTPMNITTYFQTESNITPPESNKPFKLKEKTNNKGMSLTRTNWRLKTTSNKLTRPLFPFNNCNTNRFYQKDPNVSLTKHKLKLFLDSNRGNTISSSRTPIVESPPTVCTLINNNSKMSTSNVNSTLDTIRSGTGDNMTINSYNNFSQNFVQKMFVMTSKNNKKPLGKIGPSGFGSTYMKTFYKDNFKLPIIIKKES